MDRVLDAKDEKIQKIQKIETDKLQALLDINSAQIKKELAEQLGVTQQAITVQWERFKRKADEFRMNCSKTIKIDGMTLHSFCFQSSGRKIFCTKSLWAMKSGFFIIILNVENHGLALNLRHRRQSSISTPRSYSVSSGIGKVCCVTSCYNGVKQSRQTTINNN